MKLFGWIALGGLGVGMVAGGLAGVLDTDAGPRPSWGNFWNLNGSFWNSDHCYDGKLADAVGPERRWVWDGGDSVTISVPAQIHYRGGDGDEVIVRGDPELVRHVHVRHGKVQATCNGFPRTNNLTIILPGHTFREVTLKGPVQLTMENLDQPVLNLSVGGSGTTRLSGRADEVSASIGGSGRITFSELMMKQLDLQIAGSGRIEGRGNSDNVDVSIAGSGTAALADLPMKRINITIAGSGDVEAAPQDKADITIMGSGDVLLMTYPGQVSTNIMGSGKVRYNAPKPGKEI